MLLATALGLAACGTSAPERVAPCPKAGILADTAQITYANAQNQIIMDGTIEDIEVVCRESRDSILVDASALVIFREGRAGADNLPRPEVFATLIETGDKVLEKELESVRVRFSDGEPFQKVIEFDRIRIPAEMFNPGQRRFLEILIGFQVTPQQLQQNRIRRGS